MSKQYKLSEIADYLDAKLAGDPDLIVTGIASLNAANAQQLSFLDNKQYEKLLPDTRAAAVILKAEHASVSPVATLVTNNPYISFAKATALFNNMPVSAPGIHPTSIIGKDCVIPASASIGAYTVIGDRVTLGENTVIGAHCDIGNDCQIGANCKLYDRVTFYYGTQIGKYGVVHSGAVIGADGFGFAPNKGQWVKIYQLGRVVIGDRVDIGANTTIDRGALEDTTIGNDVIIDNQVQIAHNVKIGNGCAIAGCTGIAGSAKIGNYCMLGGSVTVNGHIEICDQVSVVGATTIYRPIDKPGAYASPTIAQPVQDWFKSLAIFHKLPELAKSLHKLEKLAQKFVPEGKTAKRSWLKKLFG